MSDISASPIYAITAYRPINPFLYINPVHMMRAYQQMCKFLALSDSELRDMGLTRNDVKNARFRDFL
jgi:uncharacterized protein YjiS (DUF1127 family)